MSGIRITTGTKLWRFRRLPADLHLRAKALAAFTTQSTHVWTSVEHTMICAVSIGLDHLERAGTCTTPVAPPPPYPNEGRFTAQRRDPDDDPCDWRPGGTL